MKIEFGKEISGQNIIFYVYEDGEASSDFTKIDKELDGYLSGALKKAAFKGKADQIVITVAPKKYNLIIIQGLGKEKKFDALASTKLGGKIISLLNARKIDSATIILPNFAAEAAYGAKLRNYSFTKYITIDKKKNNLQIKSILFISGDNKKAKDSFGKYEKIAESIHFARDLITEPPNVIYPESIAKEIKKNFAKLDIKVEILGVKEMTKLGMGALLGVGQASVRESKLVVMHYMGGKKADKPLAFVGKGVTFDSGGLSIKLSNMEDMKYDMAGSAVVVGLIRALAARKAKVNAIGVVGFVENMVDGNSQRPSDVVKTMSGQTVEVLNTDAEGRLVLCDALWYCQDRFKPKFMIDVATLTGAISVALGSEYAGLFSNNDKLSDELYKASLKVDEKLWKFPMHANYDKELVSEIADFRNIPIGARSGGSIVAAKFLQKFVNKLPWAHLDIAGVAWDRKGSDFHPKGATAFGVRLLNQLVEDYYE